MADRKISDLTALTAPAAGDYLPIVDISEVAAASKNKRITIEELFRGVPNGTAAAPAIAPESDPNTGIYSPGANQLAISTNGVERLTVDSSGRLGLGTSSPTQILDLESATGARIAFTDTGLRRWSIGTPVGGSTGWSIYDESGANEALRIDVAGNVGIGTASPSSLLHLADAGNITVGTTTGTKIGTSASQKIGFFNATPVVQPTELTDELTSITHTAPGTPDYAIQDLVQNTGFGFVTKNEGNTVLSVIRNLQIRVNELETRLATLGLIADAD
jgi:hypothetical protein